MALQEASQARLAREAGLIGVSGSDLARSRAYFAALHDIGKFSRAFQSKDLGLWPSSLGQKPTGEIKASHWLLTGRMLLERGVPEALDLPLGALEREDRAPIIAAIAGHHGAPPRNEELLELEGLDAARFVGEAGLNAVRSAVTELSEIIAPAPLNGLATEEAAKVFSWSLAGLITLADWVGSDAQAMPWESPETSAKDYWPKARGKAKEAVESKGLAPPLSAPAPRLLDLFPELRQARPLQAFAEEARLPDGPVLAVIEDETGAGKTEAALMLAARMVAAGKGEGVFFALPTMATADAMFARLAQAHRRLFADGALPSIVLAHGKARLSKPFMEIRAAAGREDVAAQCAEWIADDRRKALFADIGAGTIDQTLLSVLPKRFLALRRYALAGKVLIVDEAHAFDAYMDQEIEALLAFQAASGGSAIILSATLPEAKRSRLAGAFLRGLRQGVAGPRLTMRRREYPLATTVAFGHVEESPIEPVASSRPATVVERVGEEEAAIARVLKATKTGAAVLWVRNAVDDAIKAADVLRTRGAAVDLLHARFAMVDRRRIEDDVVARFGKDGDAEGRRGRVLVSTQVCESSLDLDLDLLVSDLAPIDALVQRAGRIWRHMDRRPVDSRPFDAPRLLLLAPDPDQVSSANWIHEIQDRGGYVYPNAGVLWRTARALVEAGEIRAPSGVRALIERVYDGDAETPEPLRAAEKEAEGRRLAEEQLAKWNALKLTQGYGGAGAVHEDQEIGTRLGRPTITLRMARAAPGGAIAPWAEIEADPVRAWALSEVSLPKHWFEGDGWRLSAPQALRKTIAEATAPWPEWEREKIPVAVVQPDGRLALESAVGEQPLAYASERGLERRSPHL